MKESICSQSNPAMNRHFKLQIKTLENAPRRDADKLQESKKQKKGKSSKKPLKEAENIR
jgi:hypothetical protein